MGILTRESTRPATDARSYFFRVFDKKTSTEIKTTTSNMRLPAIFLASTAVTAQLSSLESSSTAVDEIQEDFQIEDTEFEGDLEVDDATDLQIHMILVDSVRGRGGGTFSEKRMNKQKKRKEN